jgi:hypothetical protein
MIEAFLSAMVMAMVAYFFHDWIGNGFIFSILLAGV